MSVPSVTEVILDVDAASPCPEPMAQHSLVEPVSDPAGKQSISIYHTLAFVNKKNCFAFC